MAIATGTAILGAAAIGAAGSALSGGAKSPSQRQTTTRNVPAWLQPLLEANVQRGVDISQQPLTPFGGERVAGLSPDELQAFELTRGLVGEQAPQFAQAQDILGQVAQRGLGGLDEAALAPFLNPFQEQVMDVSRQRQLEQFDLAKRDLAQQQANIGSFGGSRSALAEQALRDNFQRQLAEQESRQLFQGFEQAQQRAQTGAQLAGQAGLGIAGLAGQQQQAALQGIGALGQIGGLQRGLGQQQLDVNFQDFLTQQQFPFQQAQFAQSFINPAASLTTGTTTTGIQTPGQPGPLQAGLGAAATVGGFLGAGNQGFGTLAGSPMTGGFQGPTQGSGFLGSFFEHGGMVKAPMSFEHGGPVSLAHGGAVKTYEHGGPIGFQGGGFIPQRSRLGGFLGDVGTAFSSENPLLKDLLSRNRRAGEQLVGLKDFFVDPERPSLASIFGDPITQPQLSKAVEEAKPEIDKRVEDIMEKLGLQTPPTLPKTAQQQLTAEKTPIAQHRMNLPLINFGASLLSSNKNFFGALGDASKTFVGTKISQQEAIQEAAQKELENKLAERRLKAFEKQTDVAAAKLPLAEELQKLKIKAAQRKLKNDPVTLKIFEKIMESDFSIKPEDALNEAKRLTGELAPPIPTGGGQFLGFE